MARCKVGLLEWQLPGHTLGKLGFPSPCGVTVLWLVTELGTFSRSPYNEDNSSPPQIFEFDEWIWIPTKHFLDYLAHKGKSEASLLSECLRVFYSLGNNIVHPGRSHAVVAVSADTSGFRSGLDWKADGEVTPAKQSAEVEHRGFSSCASCDQLCSIAGELVRNANTQRYWIRTVGLGPGILCL